MQKFQATLAAILIIISTSLVAEDAMSVTSPTHRVALLELYTSEGCNSCPAAEKWLGQLTSKGYSSDKVIPIALHVDYWDYLGWRDIYSDRRHSQRQQQHVQRNKLATAYTPQLILNGKNLRPSRLLKGRLKIINAQTASIKIELSALMLENNQLAVTSHIYPVQNSAIEAKILFLALVEDDIDSNIKSGENAGRTLKHNGVTRSLLEPVSLNSDKATKIERIISIPKDANQDKLSIVAFVEAEPGIILQAVKLNLVH